MKDLSNLLVILKLLGIQLSNHINQTQKDRIDSPMVFIGLFLFILHSFISNTFLLILLSLT